MAKRLNPKQTNGFDEDRVKSFVAQIEGELDKLASEKGSYMAFAKSIRETIHEVYQTAQAMGVDKAPLKAVVSRRAMERKIEAAREDLDIDGRDKYDLIRGALGEFASTPLGVAAWAPPGNVTTLGDAAAENVRTLRRGMKSLGAQDEPPQPAA